MCVRSRSARRRNSRQWDQCDTYRQAFRCQQEACDKREAIFEVEEDVFVSSSIFHRKLSFQSVKLVKLNRESEPSRRVLEVII